MLVLGSVWLCTWPLAWIGAVRQARYHGSAIKPDVGQSQSLSPLATARLSAVEAPSVEGAAAVSILGSLVWLLRRRRSVPRARCATGTRYVAMEAGGKASVCPRTGGPICFCHVGQFTPTCVTPTSVCNQSGSQRSVVRLGALNKAVSPEIDEQLKAFDMSTVTFPIKATCDLAPEGKPCGGGAEEAPGCKGKCTLMQLDASTVKIDWEITGVVPSESGLHGFHIHETSDFSNGCISAGPHYNPFNKLHGAKEDEERHVGGLGNIKVDAEGKSSGSMTDHLVKLYGPTTCVGRSVMVHAKEDDLGLGDNSKAHLGPPWQDGFVSKITGNAGARIACGEIILEAE